MGFSNSGLINYTRLSPNCHANRNHIIDTITIHTMAGNLSVESCGELFANPARQASSNYGIGSDGRIALYVEEKSRSWCSSSQVNDHRAVTIEVASINNTDFQCSDTAYRSLIKLCADICKRNNISKLVWSTDKNTRVNHLNGCNMTAHRDFKAKACPGDWLYNHMADIAKDVNGTINGSIQIDIITEPECDSEEAMMYQFLKSKGLSVFAIFGLMGNLWAESGIRANNLQNSYEKKLDLTDEMYSQKVNDGSYTNFVQDKAGYGYAQWTFWSRKQKLYDYAKQSGTGIDNPSMQRNFLWEELSTTYKGMLIKLNAAKSLREASDIVLLDFERPADQSETVRAKRASYAQNLYNKYAESDSTTTVEVALPFTVRVIDNALNIRKGPGTNYAKTGNVIRDHGVYTIVEVQMNGDTQWGRLKSGAGWICLTKYTQKL